MIEKDLKPAKDFMDQLGAGTRSYVCIRVDHDGLCQFAMNDTGFDSHFMLAFFTQIVMGKMPKVAFKMIEGKEN